jgi:hypothetical protein
MKLFLTLLLATLCATGYGQTIKSLGYNTNGQVVYASTNPLTFTNDVRFGVAGMNIQTDGTLFFFDADGAKDFFVFDNGAGGADEARARQNLGLGATWLTNTNADTFRTNIGIPLPALTNTNNADTMRALAGSTNTNEPFSGSIAFDDGNQNTVTITVSNGIILEFSQ